MHQTRREYDCPTHYDLGMACNTHGWTWLEPFSWDDQTNTLEFSVLLGERSVDVAARQVRKHIEATVVSRTVLGKNALRDLDAMVIRTLGLKQETAGLMSVAAKHGSDYGQLVSKGAGRLLRGATLWEDAAKTLFTTNCSWSLTQRMCERMCSLTPPSPSGRRAFPSPEMVARASISELRQRLSVGYRAEYLKPLAHAFLDDPTLGNLEGESLGYEEAYGRVSRLKGFGPYASRHLLLLVGHYERIPVDTVVRDYIQRHHRCQNIENFVAKHYRSWGRYAWWGLKLEEMLRDENWLGD